MSRTKRPGERRAIVWRAHSRVIRHQRPRVRADDDIACARVDMPPERCATTSVDDRHCRTSPSGRGDETLRSCGSARVCRDSARWTRTPLGMFGEAFVTTHDRVGPCDASSLEHGRRSTVRLDPVCCLASCITVLVAAGFLARGVRVIQASPGPRRALGCCDMARAHHGRGSSSLVVAGGEPPAYRCRCPGEPYAGSRGIATPRGAASRAIPRGASSSQAPQRMQALSSMR